MHSQMLIQNSIGSVADQRLVEALLDKWSPSLSHIPANTPLERLRLANTAVMCESFAHYLRSLDEDTLSVNVGPYTKFAYRVLLDTFPNLIAHELVSVQAMTSPIGIIFYLDFIYENNKGLVQAGDLIPSNFNANYSSEYIDGAILATGDGVNYGGGGSFLASTVQWIPIRVPNATSGYSVTIKEIDATTGADVQTGTFNADGTANTATDLASGTINFQNGAITGVKFDTIPLSGNAIRLYYTYDGEANAIRPRMKLDVKKMIVEAKPRRLTTIFSVEALQDLRSQQGMNLESQISGAATREIALGIDREIVDLLFQMSVNTPATFDRVPPAGISEIDHLRSLVTVMSSVSYLIHKKTLRAPANWAVASPEGSALFEQLMSHGDYRPLWTPQGADTTAPIEMPQPLGTHGQFGIYRAGLLSNKWRMFVDPYFARDYIMLGLRGDDFTDSGFVWSPYTLLEMTPTHMDPVTGTYQKGFLSRDALVPVRPEFYGQVRILNL